MINNISLITGVDYKKGTFEKGSSSRANHINTISNTPHSTNHVTKFSLVELTVLVRVLLYVNLDIIEQNQMSDANNILLTCGVNIINGLDNSEMLYNYLIFNQTFVKLLQVINYYNSSLPQPENFYKFEDFSGYSNPLIEFQYYIIKEAVKEMLKMNQMKYIKFLLDNNIMPTGVNITLDTVMYRVLYLR
ncbi:hypothetical protein ACQ4LE_007760 [Meloidogyne hapla]